MLEMECTLTASRPVGIGEAKATVDGEGCGHGRADFAVEKG